MKYFCFRFDVDTHKCLRDGVPNLLKLADELNVKFTFFINFGQAIDHISFIKNKIRRSKDTNIKTISAFKKLGLKNSLQVVLFNPFIGKSYPNILRKILKSGNEIGLHGGKNHEAWLRHAKKWPVERTIDELHWGYKQLKNTIKKERIFGFASPGFNGSDDINKILSQLGFSYVSDTYSNKPIEKISSNYNFKNIPTNITGDGGSGYIEHCRASGMNDTEILSDFKKKLQARNKLAIVYDHPYYAGTKSLNLVKEMIGEVKKMGYNIVTMKEISQIT